MPRHWHQTKSQSTVSLCVVYTRWTNEINHEGLRVESPLSYLRVTWQFPLGDPPPPFPIHGVQLRLHSELQEADWDPTLDDGSRWVRPSSHSDWFKGEPVICLSHQIPGELWQRDGLFLFDLNLGGHRVRGVSRKPAILPPWRT